MQYEITGGSFPIVVCHLQNGERMVTESGSMVWMSLYHFQYGVMSGVRVAVLIRSEEKMLHSLR